MKRNIKLALSISDAGMWETIRQSIYYADWRECHLIKIDHWVPSTKNYCACDYNLEDISVSQRHWTKSADPRTPRSHDNPAGNLSE